MSYFDNRKVISPVNLLSFLLGIVLLVVLLHRIDFSSLVGTIFSIQPGLLVLGGAAYLLKCTARSVRFMRLNAEAKPAFPRMLRLTLASSLASQLLPLKLGELAYVYILRKEFKAPVAQGLSSLLVVRIFDLLAISLLFLLSALVFPLPDGLSVFFYSVLGFVSLLLAALGILIAAARFFPGLARSLLQTGLFRRFRVLDTVQKAITRFLQELGKYQGRLYVEMTLYAALEWLFNYAMYHALLLGLGLHPRFFDTVVTVTFAALASVLPVNSFGNFGTQEAGWASGMVLLGYSQQVALTSGFATHLLSLGYMLALGGAAWISYLAGTVTRREPLSLKLRERLEKSEQSDNVEK